MLDSEEAVYAKKYRMMKKKLRLLVYEREAFLEELKKSQRKLLKISRDKSFLLDRLVAYEQAHKAESSTDSESTESSDSEAPSAKDKKRKVAHPVTTSMNQVAMSRSSLNPAMLASVQKRKSPGASSAKVKVTALKPSMGSSASGSMLVAHDPLSREEIERRLELKRISGIQFMNIGVTPNSLPDDIFSHDNSNPAHDGIGEGLDLSNSIVKVEDDEDASLVIDMAN